MKWYHYLLLLIPVLIYLILRLGFREIIEFGYDQPRLASRVLEFIKDGNPLDTQKFAEKSPWGNISWGPSLFLFFSPFFLLSKNPLTVSLLIAIFNLLSVLLVIYIGYKYFSFRTALVAGIFLAVTPWWFIFSRMIYQPTPVPTFTAILILLTFKVLEKPKSFWVAPLIFLWGFIVQLYFHTVSAVAVGAFAIASKVKKLHFIYVILGIVLTFYLFLPYLNVTNFSDYLPQKNQSENWVPERDNPADRFKDLVPHYFLIISGGDFSWQLGNGYSDFLKLNPNVEQIFFAISLLTIAILIYNLFYILKIKKNRIFRGALLFWTMAPIPFLTFIHLPSVPAIPRYFLLVLPPLSLLWGLTIEDISSKFSEFSKNLGFLIPILFLTIPFYWLCFDIKYYQFIKTYNYPSGPLSTYSDIPYLFLKNSIDFVLGNADTKKEVVISNDENNPKVFAFDWATSYIWDNVYKRPRYVNDPKIAQYYLITTSKIDQKERFKELYKSGPYFVYKVL